MLLSADALDEQVGETAWLDCVDERRNSSTPCSMMLSSCGSNKTALTQSEDNSPEDVELPSADLMASSVINRFKPM